MSFERGQTLLNKYTIVRLLGEGGMGRVWLAEEHGFDHRLVAIKEVRLEHLAPEVRREVDARFQREIDLAARLTVARAPHVITAITAETLPDGARLLVMEYASGGAVADLLTQHPAGLPVAQALAITRQVCAALAVFHRLPMAPVHRDIKPSNLLITADGEARLSDFGLAQLGGASSGRSLLTAGGHPGTPLYMAPEQQAQTGYLTPAADLFALGCVLFEMLTGKRYRTQRPGTPPSRLNRSVPGWLDAVVARALAESPWDRYTSAEEFAAALAHPVAGAGRGRRVLSGLALALATVVLTVAIWFSVLRDAPTGGPPPTDQPTFGETSTRQPTRVAMRAGATSANITPSPLAPASVTPTVTPPPPTATTMPAAIPPPVATLPSPTATPAPDGDATATTEARVVAALLATLTAQATATAAPTATFPPTPTFTPDAQASIAAAANALATSVAATLTALPTATPTPAPTATPSPTPDLAATTTAAAVQMATSVAATLTALPTATLTSTPTATPSPTPNSRATATADARRLATSVAASLTALPTTTGTATQTPTATPNATLTARARATATQQAVLATRAALPTRTPTPKPSPTVTSPPTLAPRTCEIVAETLNLRAGPGVEYAPPLASLPRGTQLQATGRNEAATWIAVASPAEALAGWVSAEATYVTCAFAVASLPVAATPPTPTAAPTPTPRPDLQVSAYTSSGSDLRVVAGSSGGLAPGQPVYTDRAYAYRDLPAWLTRATYIVTANRDKDSVDNTFWLTLTVNTPVRLYVAHSDGHTVKPSWLHAFTDTGADLTFVDNEQRTVVLSLFARDYPAGDIVLGGNAVPGSGSHSMYTVVMQDTIP
jgi:serine/threonine protein kinase